MTYQFSNNTFKISIGLFVYWIIGLFLFLPQNAFAHVLKSDGSIGAVMHVSPEDDPVAGEQSGFFFEFKDKNNTFDPKNCECTFTILQEGKELFTQPLFQSNSQPSLTSASIFYTFPQRGVYTVRLTGLPQSGKTFNAFILDYDLRVERTANNAKGSDEKDWLAEHLSVIMGGVLGLAALLFFVTRANKNEKK